MDLKMERDAGRGLRMLAGAVMLALTALTGCAGDGAVRRPPEVPPPREVSAETLLETADLSGIGNLRSRVRVQISQNGRPRGTYSGVLYYSHPHRLNVRFLAPLGITAMELRFNRGLLQVYIPGEEVLYTGRVALESLLPDTETLRASVKVLRESDEEYQLLILDGDGPTARLRAKYIFGKPDLAWKGLELYGGGSREATIEIKETEGVLPTDFVVLVDDASFHLELKDAGIVEASREDLFRPLEASRTLPLSYFLRSLRQRSD